MNASKMKRLCKEAYEDLECLEALLPYLKDDRAMPFITKSRSDIRELILIAKYETAKNVTVEQTSHIHRILAKIRQLMRDVPDSVKRELEED